MQMLRNMNINMVTVLMGLAVTVVLSGQRTMPTGHLHGLKLLHDSGQPC